MIKELKEKRNLMTTPNTFTYTARNANNPKKVITLTLVDDTFKINLTGLFDQAREIANAEKILPATQAQANIQAKPMVMKMLETTSGAGVDINDTRVVLKDKALKIIVWYRLAGLRLAPLVIHMGEVDNPAGATAFCQELSRRQDSTDSASLFFGPLDYWLGWAGVLLFLFAFIKKKKHK
jgi:hypothetical protein